MGFILAEKNAGSGGGRPCYLPPHNRVPGVSLRRRAEWRCSRVSPRCSNGSACHMSLSGTLRPTRRWNRPPCRISEAGAPPRWSSAIADDKPLQAVVPAHYRVDFERLRQFAGAVTLRLAQRKRDRGALSGVRGRRHAAIRHDLRPPRLRGAMLRGRTGDGVRRWHAHRVALHALL